MKTEKFCLICFGNEKNLTDFKKNIAIIVRVMYNKAIAD